MINPLQLGQGADSPRRKSIATVFSLERLQHLKKDEILQCQGLLGHGTEWGVWETPDWMVGRVRGVVFKVPIRDKIICSLPAALSPTVELSKLLDEAELYLLRYALVLRMAPSNMHLGKKNYSLDPTTIAGLLRNYIPHLISVAIQRRLSIGLNITSGFFSNLQEENLSVVSNSAYSYVLAEFKRLMRLSCLGFWDDGPQIRSPIGTVDPSGDYVAPRPQISHVPHSPIPDAYLSHMGELVLWFVRDVGPILIAALESCQEALLLGDHKEFLRIVRDEILPKHFGESYSIKNCEFLHRFGKTTSSFL